MRGLLGTLAGIVLLRVLGVSLLFAGFAAHGASLGGSHAASGLAFAAYPLALALFMLPLAALSDRLGRRRVLVGALVVSAAGGLVAALANDVVTLAIGRFIQGAGALNGVALAVVGEIGEPERRTRRMAVVGAAAGMGFAGGILLGAYLTPLVGVRWLIAGHALATLAMLPVVARVVPGRAEAPLAPVADAARLDRRTLALGLAALGVNLALTALLFLSPLLLRGVRYELAITLMVLPAGAGMFLAARFADRGHARAVGLLSAGFLALAPLAFLGAVSPAVLIVAGMLFFLGHSSLSSLLPALAAEHAAEGRRGFAQGVQATLQYLGSAAGAALAGALYPRAPLLAAAFLIAGLLVAGAILWTTRPRGAQNGAYEGFS